MTELADLGVPPDLLVGVGDTAQSDAAAAERRPLGLLLLLSHPLDVVPATGSRHRYKYSSLILPQAVARAIHTVP